MASTNDAGATNNLAAIASNLPVTIYRCRVDPDWTIEFVSNDIERLTGYPASDFTERSTRDYFFLFHPEDRESVLRKWRAQFARGGTMESEFRICHADGSTRWLRDTARRIDDGQGNPRWIDGVVIDITARVDVEENLRRLLEQAPDGLLVVAEDGRITYANAQIATVLGHDPVALIGKSVELLVPKSKRAGHAGHIAKFFRSPAFRAMGSGVEFVALHADGHTIPVEIGLSPIEMGGQPLTAASVRDVSERRRVSQELRASRERLDLVVSATVEGIYDWDVKANRVWLSPHYTELLGHGEAEFLTIEAWYEFVHPDDRTTLTKTVNTALAEEKPYRLEYRVKIGDGRIRWTDDRARIVGDLASGSLRVVGSIQDITARKLDHAALEEREKLLSRIENLAAIGYWRWQPEPASLYFLSDKLRQIYGIPPERPIREFSDVYALVHPDDRAALVEFDRSLMAEPGDAEFEYRLIGPDGEDRYFHETVAIERGATGAASGLLGIVQDVTARKRTEQQLAVAQKMEAVGQLTGGISHDFNNLLGVIQGNLDLIEISGAGAPRADDYVAAIRSATERGAALIQSLLAFSRRQVLNPEYLAINDLMNRATEILMPTLGKRLTIETDLAPDIPILHVDPGLLENALLNLAINARDAMTKDGKLAIATSHETIAAATAAERGVAAGDYIAIRVADTGRGMPASVLERAIEPFFSTKGPDKGTGLGLSMIHGFVTQSGGFMTIESEVGQGTTVSLFLPVPHDTRRSADDEPDREADAVEAGGDFERHGTVLVAEDDAAVRVAATRMLTSLDYRVIEAGDGASALLRLAENPTIDILFTDLVMPGPMNGLDLARECRRLRPEVRILCTSGHPPELDAAIVDEIANVRMLKKPYSVSALAETLEALQKAD